MAPIAKQRLGVVARHVVLPSPVSGNEVAEYKPGKYYGVLPDYEHPIIMAEGGILSKSLVPPILFSTLLADAAKHVPDHVALAVEKNPPPPEAPGVAPPLPWEKWTKWTFKQYYEDARRAAKAFMVMGVEQFGSVSIFGFNSPEWCISAFGAMLCGGKYVGIYSTDTPAQLQYKVAHSQTRVLVVDGQTEFDCVATTIDELPNLNAVIVWGMPAPASLQRKDGSSCRVMAWADCMALGDAEGSNEKLDQRMAAQREAMRLKLNKTQAASVVKWSAWRPMLCLGS